VNNKSKNNILIAEFTESHTELIHSQILFLLKNNYNITLWLNSDAEFEDKYSGKVKIIREGTKISSLNIGLLYKIVRYIQRNKIKKLVLNTAHGLLARNLCLLLINSKVEVIGVIHQAHKLLKSSNQKIISRKIKKYFVLNDYIKTYIDFTTQNFYNVGVFYPIFFNKPEEKLIEKSDKVIITIPGEVQQMRKDYIFLIEQIFKLKKEIREKFEFVFLGCASKQKSSDILELLDKNKQIEDSIKIFKKHVAENEFNSYIQNSDFIMPLIHPSSKSYNEYLTTEISGAFNTAFAFKKPMLMYNSFKQFDDFKNFSTFYNENNFIDILTALIDNNSSEVLIKNYDSYKKFDFDFQAENYIKFIES